MTVTVLATQKYRYIGGLLVAPGRPPIVPPKYTGGVVLPPPDNFVLGTTKPTAANTGLNVLGLTTTDLTIINGDVTINDAYVAANGNALDRLWIKGHINFTASQPVTISNSKIQGRTFTGAAPWDAIIHARSTSTPTTAVINFDNCEITCIQPNVGISNAAGERLGYFHRCDISLGSDGIDYWAPAKPNVEGSYLHHYTVWANDPKHTSDGRFPGWSHNDLIQNSGSDGGHIVGNAFTGRFSTNFGDYATFQSGGFPNGNWGSNIILTPSTSRITNLDISQNWFDGSEVQCFMPQQSGGAYNNGNSWKVHDNRFSPNTHGYGPYSGLYSLQVCYSNVGMGPVIADFYQNVWDPAAPSSNTVGIAGDTVTMVASPSSNPTQYLAAYNSPTQINN